MSNLLPRLATAAVGIPVLLWLVHAGSVPFLLFMLTVTALCLWEYGQILELGRRPVHRGAALVLGCGLAALLMAGGPALGSSGNALAGLGLSLAVVSAVLLEMFQAERSLDRLALTLLGVFFIAWTLPHLYLLRDLRPNGESWLWMLFICVWTMDTAAYAAGHAFGRTPLSALSPKKTWEGAFAATAAAVAVAVAVRTFGPLKATLGPLQAAAFGAGIAVFGQLSDLAESMVKRAAGVKDSGYLLPGHGGVLDRFDSFLLAGPLAYYAAALLGPRP